YVTRPSRSASESSTSSYLNLSPSSPRENSNDQPPYLKSSAPPGSSITPSSETNSVTTIRPIRYLRRRCYAIQPEGLATYQMNTSSVDQLSLTFAALADP